MPLNLNYFRNNTELFSQSGIALVVMDCPSDENSVASGNTPLGCNDDYRSSVKHADDVRKIIGLLREKYEMSKRDLSDLKAFYPKRYEEWVKNVSEQIGIKN